MTGIYSPTFVILPKVTSQSSCTKLRERGKRDSLEKIKNYGEQAKKED
jgi:hypothetical protein